MPRQGMSGFIFEHTPAAVSGTGLTVTLKGIPVCAVSLFLQ